MSHILYKIVTFNILVFCTVMGCSSSSQSKNEVDTDSDGDSDIDSDADSDSDVDSDADTDTWPNGDTAPEGYGSVSEMCWIKTFFVDAGECDGIGFQGVLTTDAEIHEDGTSIVAGQYRGSVVFGNGEPDETVLEPTYPGECDLFDTFIACLNGNGSTEWAIRIGAINQQPVNIVVEQSANGDIVVLGSFKGTAIFGEGTTNETVLDSGYGSALFLARYDSGAGLIWVRKDGGEAGVSGDGLAILSDDSMAVSGVTNGDMTFGEGEVHETYFDVTSDPKGFIARYYDVGELAWVREANGGKSSRNFAVSSEGEFLVPTVGYMDAEGPIATEYDYLGNEGWDYSVNSENAMFTDAVGVGAMSYMVVGIHGQDIIFPSSDDEDTVLTVPCVEGESTVDCWQSGFAARLTQLGELEWAMGTEHGIGSKASMLAVGIASSDFLVSGFYQGAVKFGEGEPEVTWLVSSEGLEPFMAKYNGEGEFIWVKRVGKNWNKKSYAVATGSLEDGSYLLAGAFSGSVEFLVGEDAYQTISAESDRDGFVARSCP